MRFIFIFLYKFLLVSSVIDVPRWIVVEDCPDCRFCLILEGLPFPNFCVSSIEDFPSHVLASFNFTENKITTSTAELPTTHYFSTTASTTPSSVTPSSTTPSSVTPSSTTPSTSGPTFCHGLLIGVFITFIAAALLIALYFLLAKYSEQVPLLQLHVLRNQD